MEFGHSSRRARLHFLTYLLEIMIYLKSNQIDGASSQSIWKFTDDCKYQKPFIPLFTFILSSSLHLPLLHQCSLLIFARYRDELIFGICNLQQHQHSYLRVHNLHLLALLSEPSKCHSLFRFDPGELISVF